MSLPGQGILHAYVAHCPSCGHILEFTPAYEEPARECVRGVCLHVGCGRVWSFIFDIDASGTFGVMSFQCDNEDRIL